MPKVLFEHAAIQSWTAIECKGHALGALKAQNECLC